MQKLYGTFSKVESIGQTKSILRILTGKKHRQIELQRLQKVGIWAFGSLVDQIN